MPAAPLPPADLVARALGAVGAGRRCLWVGLLCSAGLAGAPRAAQACSIAAPAPHEIDPAEAAIDSVAPQAPTKARVESIQRGRGPDCDASGACMSTSCDDIGTIQVVWTSGGDDRTPDEALGVILRVVEGDAPDRLFPTGEAVATRVDGSVSLIWIDGADDLQEPLDFVLSITEVDLAGNESGALEVHITDPGSGGGAAADDGADDKGCASLGAAAGGGLGLLVALGGVLARRRQRTGQTS